MRIVSGSARGRRLKAPRNQLTRPMADKIKEALFSSLDSFGIAPERILDLYAGSGSVGIEALSRGGEWCDFVDRDRQACQTIRENLAATGFEDVARVHQMTVRQFIAAVATPYDFIIIDPPYADPDIVEALEAIQASRAVGPETVVVMGHWPRLTVPDEVGKLMKLRERCHGDSCFSIYEMSAEGELEH
jgi:16S rRNA (guanine966-N2)-methyltransferase